MREKKRLFLLGGHDLEMIEIEKLLRQEGCKEIESLADTKEGACFYADRNLSWSDAELEAYQDLLPFEGEIYGIELRHVDKPPPNYILLDHHGPLWCRPSALEQVAELFDIPLDRHRQLVAANDKGHIAALKAMNATEEEIASIRAEDRRAQGVSEAQERQAEEDAKKVEKRSDLYIARSTLEHFSPLVDRLTMAGKTPLIVYNDKSLNYYGPDALKLAEHYKEAVDRGQAYYGGNPPGYFGLTEAYFDTKTPEEIKEEIIATLLTNDRLYSYHNFMFPFRFDKIFEPIIDRYLYYKQRNFDERVKIDEKFADMIGRDGWCYRPFRVGGGDDPASYNEYAYFHDFVRDALFNRGGFDRGATSYYFEKELSSEDRYEIDVGIYRRNEEKKRSEYQHTRHYSLRLIGLSLRIFDTGVGILSIETENHRYGELEDILRINDFGRRIYAQFLGRDEDSLPWSHQTNTSFLPEKIGIVLSGERIEEDFSADYREIPDTIRLSRVLRKVMGERSFTTRGDEIGKYLLRPIIDDRMFVISWYGNDALSCKFQKESYVEMDEWYRYLFLDGRYKTIASPRMQEELVRQCTYDRWMLQGALYGVSRYSFVVLTDRSGFALDVISRHARTTYYQLFTLLLAQRASILRFSDEVAALSDIDDDARNSLSLKASRLYKNYIRFVNKLYFREVTPQEQGIELYDMARTIMRIDSDIKDLDNEIAELHSYVQMIDDQKRSEKMDRLSQLGYLFLPPTFIAGFFGMNIFAEAWGDSFPATVFVLALVFGSGYWIYRRLDIDIHTLFSKEES